MRLGSFTTCFAVSNAALGAFAGPLAAKRQDAGENTSATATSSATRASTESSSSSASSIPQNGLLQTTDSDGKTVTIPVANPQATDPTSTAEVATTYTYSRTGLPKPIATQFPKCNAPAHNIFCLPNDLSDIYVGKTYFATWNPDVLESNSTVEIKLKWPNDSETEAWSSPPTMNHIGFVTFDADKEWKQGYDMYNLTFTAVNYKKSDPDFNTKEYNGPRITVKNEPPRHYEPPPPTSVDKKGLMIGLPVGLGFVLLVVVGLFFGMRKHRVIGLGNVMGRRNKGYAVGKSRRQRLGLGKKGAIKLEERGPMPQYSNAREHAGGDSLGSLVSDDDEIRPAPGQNQFRDEIQRQRTGR